MLLWTELWRYEVFTLHYCRLLFQRLLQSSAPLPPFFVRFQSEQTRQQLVSLVGSSCPLYCPCPFRHFGPWVLPVREIQILTPAESLACSEVVSLLTFQFQTFVVKMPALPGVSCFLYLLLLLVLLQTISPSNVAVFKFLESVKWAADVFVWTWTSSCQQVDRHPVPLSSTPYEKKKALREKLRRLLSHLSTCSTSKPPPITDALRNESWIHVGV